MESASPAAMAKQKINCPVCGKAVEYTAMSEIATFPFCSSRCKWADLDKWMEGEYRISEDIKDASAGEEGPVAGLPPEKP